MKLTTPLKIFLSVALLAGGAQAASLSLGAGQLSRGHGAAPNTTLTYTDASGIVITYTKSNQSDFIGAAGLNSRGWSHDPATDVIGFQEIAGVVPDHLAISHFDAGDQVNISFSGASNVNLSTVKLVMWDLDTNLNNGNSFQEFVNLVDGAGVTQILGSAVALTGDQNVNQALTIGNPAQLVQLKANVNPNRDFGLSAFTLTWDAVPEPSTGLLALLGSTVLFFRRRR
ncbi:MAG: hypothetical protein ACI9R3_003078 [Verrucomicrobiales bacterium]|jgi:hypothetical protein